MRPGPPVAVEAGILRGVHTRFHLSALLPATGVGEQKGGLVPPEETYVPRLDPVVAADGEPTESPAAMVSVSIKSKLGLEPSDHHDSRPRASVIVEPLPGKRARLRRHLP